jgi:hypothetical protein
MPHLETALLSIVVPAWSFITDTWHNTPAVGGAKPRTEISPGSQAWKSCSWAWGLFCVRGFVSAGVSAYLRSMPRSLILIDAIMSAIDDYAEGG